MKALEKLFSEAIKNPDSDYCEITKCYEKVKSAIERKEKLEKAWELVNKYLDIPFMAEYGSFEKEDAIFLKEILEEK